MAKRVNFMLDDDSWRDIERLARGTRSRAINHRHPVPARPPSSDLLGED